MSDADATVTLRGVTVRYAHRTAVDSVDLTAGPGEMLAVTGPSGAGKSTLLWAVAGAVPLAAGEVTVGQTVIADRRTGVREEVALIPQGNGLATVLTAWENVALPLMASGLSPIEARRQSDDALADVGLDDSANHLVEELSGGQQQRVAVARTLAGAPRVLLADEPTSELDHANRERVLGLLRSHADRGAVVIMATHDPEAAEHADREVRLDEGVLHLIR